MGRVVAKTFLVLATAPVVAPKVLPTVNAYIRVRIRVRVDVHEQRNFCSRESPNIHGAVELLP